VYWHYTIGTFLQQILSEGIQPATAFVPKTVRPIVWFTVADRWEETANKQDRDFVPLTREETHVQGGGLVRIGVNGKVRLHHWMKLMRLSGESKGMVESLRRTAEKEGSNPVRDWYGCFTPVPTTAFETIEFWNGSEWSSVRPTEFSKAAKAGR